MRAILIYLMSEHSSQLWLEPKFLGCIDNQIFLPMALRWARFARETAPL